MRYKKLLAEQEQLHAGEKNKPEQLKLNLKDTVFESNEIARAVWKSGSVYSRRLFVILLSKIKKEDVTFQEFSVKLNDILGYDCNSKTRQELRRIIKTTAQQAVCVKYNTDKIHGEEEVVYSLFDLTVGVKFDLSKSNGVEVTAKLNDALRPYYLGLAKKFTAYPLEEFLPLTSVYHQTLYVFLKSWESKRTISVAIKELYIIFDVPENYRRNFNTFEKDILIPASIAVNEKTSLKFWYSVEKENGVVLMRDIKDGKIVKDNGDKRSTSPVAKIVFHFINTRRVTKLPATKLTDANVIPEEISYSVLDKNGKPLKDKKQSKISMEALKEMLKNLSQNISKKELKALFAMLTEEDEVSIDKLKIVGDGDTEEKESES